MSLARVVSVNLGATRPMVARNGVSGIDKRPVTGLVEVGVPSPGSSGLAGDAIGDPVDHGGLDRAVSAYAREDLDAWQAELGVPLASGVYGENLTTAGLDVTDAEIGERWRVGASLVLEVSAPRLPCRTFAAWIDRPGWVRTFTERGMPGAYLRVVSPGAVCSGDTVEVVARPGHGVTVGVAFRAITTSPDLLPLLADVHALAEDIRATVARRLAVRR
jgi:MOSC domain-containing protein YiiM